MDGHRFDALTRALASTPSRRRVLRGLAAGLVAALGISSPGEAARTRPVRDLLRPRRLRRPAGCPSSTGADARCGGGCCPPGMSCFDGSCAPIGSTRCGAGYCPARQVCAGGGCLPAGAVPCGGGFCPAGQTCADERCLHCTGAETMCGDQCVDLQSDRANCGACGRACPVGSCVRGACSDVLGAPCTRPDDCASGHCVDGVCCDQACAGQCEACNAAGSAGACVPISGAPVGARPPCASDGSACGGACNGIDGDACAYPGAETACRPAGCSNGRAILAAACDGQGACPLTTVDCAPYACVGTTCLSTCAADSDCQGAACIEGICCPSADVCPAGDGSICCDPDRPSTETCCFGEDRCCECFLDTCTSCSGEPFCCPADKVCRSPVGPTGDACCYNDEVCVNGACCHTTFACEGKCCDTPCCNGVCCPSGQECVNGGCVTPRSCDPAVPQDPACLAGEICANFDRKCCTPDRVIEFEIDVDGVPTTISICCPYGTAQHVNGDPICCDLPDRCGTFRVGRPRA